MKKANLAVSLVLGLPLAALAAVRVGSGLHAPQETGNRAEIAPPAEPPRASVAAGPHSPPFALVSPGDPTLAAPLPLSPETHTEPRMADEPGELQEHHHDLPETTWRAPLTWKCKGERAYLATAMNFTSPTPERLGKALAGVTTRGAAALVMLKSGEDFLVALSATERRPNKSEAFPAEAAPSFVRLVDGFGAPPGVSSDRFQPRGYLRIADGQQSSWLELRNINWRAVEKGECGEISVDAYAHVPASSWGVSLRTSAGPRAFRDLLDAEHLADATASPKGARNPSAEPPSITLHFAFKATPATVERDSPRGPS